MKDSSNYDTILISMNTIMQLVSKVVMRYVCKSSIPMREKEDVEMAIMEKILKQQEKINFSFEKRANIKTYYVAIINRMCCEVIRSESKHWFTVSDFNIEQELEKKPSIETGTDKPLIIKKEIKRLFNVLLLFNKERGKVLLFIKFLFDIPFGEAEVQEYCNGDYNRVKHFFDRDKCTSQADIYNALAQITNTVEGKNIKGDSVRMWMNNQIELILKRMNNYGESNHCRESLKILLEMENIHLHSNTRDKKVRLYRLKTTKE